MKKRNCILALFALVLTFFLPALALSDNILSTVQVHGFVGQGYLKSDNNNYLANTTAGSFNFNEIGLNVSAEPVEKLRIGIQLFSRDLGNTDKNRVDLDWAFADYHWKDYFGIRMGKCKTPMGLYHDVSDLDMTRTTVFLPLTVYDPRFRTVFMATVGVEGYGHLNIKPLGSLDYVGFFGTNILTKESLETLYASIMDMQSVGIKGFGGGRLIWNTPLKGLLFGGSILYGENYEASGTLTSQLTKPLPIIGQSIYPAGTDVFHKSKEVTVWYAFAEFTYRKLTLAAEFNRIILSGKLTTDQPFNPMVGMLIGFNGIPNSRTNRAGWYAQANYQVIKWLTVAGTYGEFYSDWNDREGKNITPNWAGFQKDIALSVRFDINSHWDVKLETHFFDGVGLLLGDEEQGSRHWNLYAIKTSVYF